MREIVPGVYTWSVRSEERNLDFNGFAVTTAQRAVLIDPPEPSRETWAELDLLAPYECVFVTNRNHSRAASRLRDRYDVPVRLHRADAPQAVVDADETVRGGETVAGEIRVLNVPGKSPGEIAFHLPRRRALVVGDLVIGPAPGELATYPPDKVDDHEELVASARKLLELDFDALLLCDGDSIVSGGKERLRAFVEAAEAA